MTEIWKDVVGYEGIYEVSNFGNVRTHKNKKSWSKRHNTWRYWKQRNLKNKMPNGRDVRVTLWKDGNVKDWLVHRLVAYAFIPNTDATKNCINHIDGNPKNNHVENLESCNHKENNNHGFDNDLINTNDKIILLDKKTNESFYFRSKAKASEFIGKSRGYISNVTKQDKFETKDYIIFISPSSKSKRYS